MFKTFLAFLAIALLADALAFDSHYRIAIIASTMHILRYFLSLDWMGFLD